MKTTKLSTKFILLFTAVLTGIFTVMLVVVQVSANTVVRDEIATNIFSFHDDVDKSVVSVIDEVAYAYARMVKEANSDKLNNLASDNGYGVRLSALQSLMSLSQASDTFNDVGWHDEGGYLSANGYASPSEDVFATAEKNKNSIVVGDYKGGCHSFVIYMDNELTRTKGSFVFFMPETTIAACLSGVSAEEGYSYIISRNGYVFSHKDNDIVGKYLYYENMYSLDGPREFSTKEFNGKKRIVAVSEMTTAAERYGVDYHLVSVLDYNYYYGTFDLLTVLLAAITGAVFVAGVVFAIVRAKKLSKPITELYQNVETTIRTGEKEYLKFGENDELYKLEEKYDEMVTHIFDLMKKSRDDAEMQRKLELDSLQMQINPHFLYNTLDALSWMARLKGDTEIENLAVNLAMFFRLSLHKGDKFITVGEELELVGHYLEIEQIRCPDKVKVTFETDEKLSRYKTLKLILQPVVENAVKHAFVEKQGNLTIRTYLDGNDIVFEVEDDGIGFDTNADKAKKESDLGGFGLYNVNERIKLEYGEDYGVTVHSEIGKGTKVVLKIAKRI